MRCEVSERERVVAHWRFFSRLTLGGGWGRKGGEGEVNPRKKKMRGAVGWGEITYEILRFLGSEVFFLDGMCDLFFLKKFQRVF